GPGVHGGFDLLVLDHRAVLALVGDAHGEPTGGSTVLFADDDILRDVHQAPGEVPGVRGTQRGVGQPLAGTVGREEVLQYRQPLTVVGLDRARDDLPLRVSKQTAHAGDMTHLGPVTPGTGTNHLVDGVTDGEVLLHRVIDLVCRLGPNLNEFGAAFDVGDEAAIVLGLHLACAFVVFLEDLFLILGADDVRDRDRHTGA